MVSVYAKSKEMGVLSHKYNEWKHSIKYDLEAESGTYRASIWHNPCSIKKQKIEGDFLFLEGENLILKIDMENQRLYINNSTEWLIIYKA